MSYKTNPISNRLGISTGWDDMVFFSNPKFYSDSFQKKVRLYFFIKEYFQKKNIKLLGFRLKPTIFQPQLHLSLFSYKNLKNRRNRDRSKPKVVRAWKLETKWKSKWVFKRDNNNRFSNKHYNAFLSILGLRFKLKNLLRKLGFPSLQINLTQPLKGVSQMSIKRLRYSRFLRRNSKEKFFESTIQLLHLVEKFQDVQLFANHVAQELAKLKNHWVMVRTLKTVFRFWNFYHKKPKRRKFFKKKWKNNKMKVTFYKPWWKTKFLWRRKAKLFLDDKPKKELPKQELFLQKKVFQQNLLLKKRRLLCKQHEYRKSIIGLRVGIFGKINASKRTRQAFVESGVIPVQMFNRRIIYAFSQARARTGTFGIKIWIYI